MNHTNLPQIEIKSFDLCGKALICRWELRDSDTLGRSITEDEIKQRFAHQIAEAMMHALDEDGHTGRWKIIFIENYYSKTFKQKII
jgi:hypothetical protein